MESSPATWAATRRGDPWQLVPRMIPHHTYRRTMQFPLPIKRRTEPQEAARHLIEALRRGETGSCIGYKRSHHRHDDRVDRLLRAIDELVRAELPTVQCSRLHHGDAERLWVWSRGEPEGVAFWPRQEPEEGVALFPQHERGSEMSSGDLPPGPVNRGRSPTTDPRL